MPASSASTSSPRVHAEGLRGGVEVEPVAGLVLHLRQQDGLAPQAGRTGDPVALRLHPDDLGVRVLGDLADQRPAVPLGHPVARLDPGVGRDQRVELGRVLGAGGLLGVHATLLPSSRRRAGPRPANHGVTSSRRLCSIVSHGSAAANPRRPLFGGARRLAWGLVPARTSRLGALRQAAARALRRSPGVVSQVQATAAEQADREAAVVAEERARIVRDEEREGDLPGLADLPALAASFRSAGVPVRLSLHPGSEDLDPRLGLAVYRIVEEGLDNARRHAPGARVRVEVRVGAGVVDRADGPEGGPAVTVLVSDDGEPAGLDPPGAGRGLIALRERVRRHGGAFSSGPAHLEGGIGSGWTIRATLPARGSHPFASELDVRGAETQHEGMRTPPRRRGSAPARRSVPAGMPPCGRRAAPRA